MKTVKENTKTLERFLGQNVRVILQAPSGARKLLPMDKLIYKEWTAKQREGFYLATIDIRLRPSQLTSTSIAFNRHGQPYSLLSFDLGRYVMEEQTHEDIKHKLYSNN